MKSIKRSTAILLVGLAIAVVNSAWADYPICTGEAEVPADDLTPTEPGCESSEEGCSDDQVQQQIAEWESGLASNLEALGKLELAKRGIDSNQAIGVCCITAASEFIQRLRTMGYDEAALTEFSAKLRSLRTLMNAHYFRTLNALKQMNDALLNFMFHKRQAIDALRAGDHDTTRAELATSNEFEQKYTTELKPKFVTHETAHRQAIENARSFAIELRALITGR